MNSYFLCDVHLVLWIVDDVASFSLLFLSAIESVTIASNVLLSFVFPFNDDDDSINCWFGIERTFHSGKKSQRWFLLWHSAWTSVLINYRYSVYAISLPAGIKRVKCSEWVVFSCPISCSSSQPIFVVWRHQKFLFNQK